MTAIEIINHAATAIVPEIILVGTVCVMFLVGPFLVDELGENRGLRHRWGALSLFALLAAASVWWWHPGPAIETGPFRVDDFTWLIRGMSLAAGMVLTLVAWNQVDEEHAAELHACLLSIIVGVNLVALSNDLVGLFLGLELVSIPTYVLLYLPHRGREMREATLKYFLLSIFSSAIFLYGVAWLFGVAGTTSMPGIAAAVNALPAGSRGITLGLALMLMGLAFRLTAVPFHFYAPDVFQGATSSTAALLSFIPKVVGLAALLRILPLTTGVVDLKWWFPTESVRLVLGVLAVVTMFAGNLLALRQKNLLRLIAYSSVGHAGYMLVGLASANGNAEFNGPAAVLFYLAAYGLMTIGALALLTCTGAPGQSPRTIDDVKGLAQTHPLVALLLAVCLFSLMGLPPTAGFLGKLGLFLSAWSSGTEFGRWLAVFLGVNAVIATWYYLRLVALMYLEPAPSNAPRHLQAMPLLAGSVCAAGTALMFFIAQPMWDAALRACL